MPRSSARLALAMAFVAAGTTLAAAPADTPEIVDGCGTDSHVMGDDLDHPYSEGTDIDTVDLSGTYELVDGAPDEAYELVGFEVAFEMCGELSDVATGELITTSWSLDPVARGVTECDRLNAGVEVLRDVEDGSLRADYTETCITEESGNGSGTATYEERLRLTLPPTALAIDGTTHRVTVRNRDIRAVTTSYVEAETLAAPRGRAVPIGGAVGGVNLHVPIQPTGQPDQGAAFSLMDRTERGTDHVLGSDPPG